MATSNAATNYTEHAILQFLFKNNTESFASPGNSIYVGLATAVSSIETGSVTEADFTNYARQQVAAANIEFPASGGGGDDVITHVFVVDAASSGNILFVGALDASKTIASGDIFRINTGNLSIELK